MLLRHFRPNSQLTRAGTYHLLRAGAIRAAATCPVSGSSGGGGSNGNNNKSKPSSGCPIAGFRDWIKHFTIKHKLCPWSHLGLPKTKFIRCQADATWSKDKVYELVRAEALELLEKPEAAFPGRMGTFIIFDHLQYGELDPHFHYAFERIHKGQDFKGPDMVTIQYFSPKWPKSFHAPFEAFHIVTKEALEWAEQKFYRTHPDIRHDHLAVAEYVYSRNEKTWDQLHDSGELAKLVKESSHIRKECLGDELGVIPPLDLDSFLSDQRQELHVHVG